MVKEIKWYIEGKRKLSMITKIQEEIKTNYNSILLTNAKKHFIKLKIGGKN